MTSARCVAFPLAFAVACTGACGGAPATRVAEPHALATAPTLAKPRGRHAELSAEEVVQHLRGNETDLRRCFFSSPGSRGSVRFAWQLDDEGRVHGVHPESSTLGDARVESCLAERLGEIRFGDLAEPGTARWTFVFRLAKPQRGRGHHSGASSNKRAAENDDRGVVLDRNSSGVLATDAIDNVVEAGYPLFARCYRDGISRNSGLRGNIRLHFFIAPSGTVSDVSDGGSDLSDHQVVDCLAEGFYALRFPPPSHGSVGVLYHIRFDTG